MSLVAKIAERVTEVLPHSGVDGARELIIAPGPDFIAPAGNAVSTLPVAHVLMGLTIVAVLGLALLRIKNLSLRSLLPF